MKGFVNDAISRHIISAVLGQFPDAMIYKYMYHITSGMLSRSEIQQFNQLWGQKSAQTIYDLLSFLSVSD